jgi:hypothetical protein
VPGSPEEEDVELLTVDELKVTPTGQVATSLESESFHSLSREAARKLSRQLEQRRQLPEHLESVRQRAADLSGWNPSRVNRLPLFAGTYQRMGYLVEKYVIQGEGDYPVPYLLFVPSHRGPRPAIIYLHPDGKAAAAGVGGRLERLAQAGFVVLAPDLVGIGETAPSADAWELAMLTGKSLIGIRAGDIARLVGVLKQRPDVDAAAIMGVAQRELGAELLHAAAFVPEIASVALLGPLLSYQALLEQEQYDPSFVAGIVPRALTAYDLPDLAATLAPRRLLITSPIDGLGRPVAQAEVEQAWAILRAAYQSAPTKWSLGFTAPDVELQTLLDWVGQAEP